MALGKKELLAELQLKKDTVTLSSGVVNIRELSAPEYLAIYHGEAAKDKDGEFDGNKFTSLLVAACVVDAKGARLFTDGEAEQLSGGSSSVYLKLALKVKELNGLGISPKN